MKKLIVIMLVVGIWFPALAQQSEELFSTLTEKYADQDGFSASMLTNDMFELYLRKKNVEEGSEVAEVLKNLDNILVVSQSKFGVNVEEDFFNGNKTPKTEKSNLDEVHKEILAHYKNSGFSLLKTEKRMGEDVKVYLRKDNGKIASMALITNSSSSTNLVEINGDIDLVNVASLSKAMNLKGLENLYKIDNSSHGFISGAEMWRNYHELDEERIAEMEARAREMAEKHAKLSEEQIKQIEKQAQAQAQKQREMFEKQRQMAEIYGRQPIFLSTPGDTNTVYYIDGKVVESDEVKAMLKDGEVKQITKTEKDGKTIIKIKTK